MSLNERAVSVAVEKVKFKVTPTRLGYVIRVKHKCFHTLSQFHIMTPTSMCFVGIVILLHNGDVKITPSSQTNIVMGVLCCGEAFALSTILDDLQDESCLDIILSTKSNQFVCTSMWKALQSDIIEKC